MIGSVSHGTLRNEDLFETFLDVLEDLDPAAAKRISEQAPEDFNDAWYESEECCWLISDLFDALDNCAEPGYYFGAHPGGGVDFGFWELPEEEDYED